MDSNSKKTLDDFILNRLITKGIQEESFQVIFLLLHNKKDGLKWIKS